MILGTEARTHPKLSTINSYIDSQMANTDDKNQDSFGNQRKYSKISKPELIKQQTIKSSDKNSKGE
jgi:hypothetical protein